MGEWLGQRIPPKERVGKRPKGLLFVIWGELRVFFYIICSILACGNFRKGKLRIEKNKVGFKDKHIGQY